MNAGSNRAREIFVAAVGQVAPEGWDAYVEEACAGDEVLLGRVKKLLQVHAAAGSFLESPGVPLAIFDEPLTERPGTLIGPYKLMEQIGEGGMGLVFIAEQQQPVRRKVALKIIKPGMDTRQVIARFEAERQALALMDHPNIAKVLDAGATESGRPYFVMEFVKGVCLTDYCDQNRLGTRQRLELFDSVCLAVQHAHQKGIIHRDLKPSNVLVAVHDVTPVVKVIDFGVAKATGQQLTEKTLYTAVAQMVGTPQYMSPEQAGLSALDVDTRSDIYSLGVLLYELLTGTTPFDSETLLKAAYDEMRRIIREDEPQKPSTRLSTLDAAALSTLCERRGVDPRQLSREMCGELDWMVMKALEKDRNRRYESASAFAADVQRHLNDEPVAACPPSAGYKMRKFLKRNKRPVLAATALVLVLLLTVAGLTAGLLAVDRERSRTAAALAAEAKRRQQTRQALDMMSSTLIEDWLAKQEKLLPEHRAFLEQARTMYEDFAADVGQDEEVRAGVARAHRRIGEIQERLGHVVVAEQAYQQSNELYRQLVADFPTHPEYRYQLALSHNLLGREGDTRIGEADCREAVRLLRQLAADFPAIPKYRSDLAKGLIRCAERHVQVAQVSNRSVSFTEERDGLIRESVSLLRQVVADFPDVPSHRKDLAEGLTQFANMIRDQKSKEAEQAFREALALLTPLANEFRGDPHLGYRLAFLHAKLGLLFRQTVRHGEAEKAYREALVASQRLVADFPGVPSYREELINAHEMLGRVLVSSKKTVEAEEAIRQALVECQRLAAALPGEPRYREWVADAHNHLGYRLDVIGKTAEAEKAYREALAIGQKVLTDFPTYINVPDLGPSAMSTMTSASRRLGDLLKKAGRSEEALAVYRKAAELGDKNVRTQYGLGNTLREAGYADEAAKQYKKVIDLAQAAIKLEPTNAEAHNVFAWILATCPDPSFRDGTKAVQLAQKAIKLNASDARIWNTLGAAQYRAGDWNSAITSLEKSMEMGKNPDWGGGSSDWFFLAMCHWQLGHREQAQKWFARAVEWMDKNKSADLDLHRCFRAEAAELLKGKS